MLVSGENGYALLVGAAAGKFGDDAASRRRRKARRSNPGANAPAASSRQGFPLSCGAPPPAMRAMIPHDTVRDRGFWRILLVFLKLGLTSFGGPVAHLGYFRAEFVERRRWLPERDYADLVALCQFLPGPASSQVGMGLGLARGGLPGALAAWLGFTLPSALIMLALAAGLSGQAQAIPPGLLHGLKLAAVAVVAQAVWSMARQLCPDRPRLTLMAAACCLALLIHAPWLPLAVIALAGVAGRYCLPAAAAPPIAADSALPPSAAAARCGWRCSSRCWPACRCSPPSFPAAAWRCSTPSTAAARWCSAAATWCCRCWRTPPWPAAGWRRMLFWPATARRRPARTAVRLRGLSRRRRRRLAGRRAGAGRHLPARLPAAGRRAAVLAPLARRARRPIGAGRGQRRGGRPAAGRVLPPGLD
ncbi:chromate transporter, chromate ion transporter (CHR) family [Chromobacterium violaceum]|uniref:Chromate transporter, chromate ion transporter (CHR) family n=1 Tax=Chromobacterium violaceum TaxID=536 RepID=A0A447T8Z8_CHRVL|nr:chromate transporter, chromate ion transporter (CHR) family [Chromobacterium violaceum]